MKFTASARSKAAPSAIEIAQRKAGCHPTSAIPQQHASVSPVFPMWLIACCRMRVHWHMRDMMRAPLPKRAVASKAANLPYAELEASPVSPANWAGLARALYTVKWPNFETRHVSNSNSCVSPANRQAHRPDRRSAPCF